MSNRKKFSVCINFTIAFLAMLGIGLSLVFSVEEGFSPWWTRLLYFTQQSNIWIGLTCLIMAILSVTGVTDRNDKVKKTIYLMKFTFTVSITLTCLIFCCFLAPFADFDVWTASSILTHVLVPVLAVVDLFIDDTMFDLQKKHAYLPLLPMVYYFVFATSLSAFKVDFGRGEPFPYFFFNYFSEVGVFGFKGGEIFQMGSAYWFIIIMGMALGFGMLYFNLHPITKSKNKGKKALAKRVLEIKNQSPS